MLGLFYRFILEKVNGSTYNVVEAKAKILYWNRKCENIMDMQILETIGLTKREAEVYTTLLRLGESPVADILKEIKAHSQLIYRAIEGLNEKGLLNISYRRHRMYVRAEDPHRLKKLEEQKLREINKLIPDLLALQSTSRDTIVRVDKGNEAIRALRRRGIEELSEGGTYYIITAAGQKFYEVMGDVYAEIERKRIKKKAKRRLISYESERKLLEKNDRFKELVEYRYLPESYSTPTSTNIFNDTLAILVWSNDPIVITIESPEIAQSYKDYFETVWKVAKL
jgi:HTH-type transcriptional regulator, sugar sensing transcriptional regulator